MSVCHVCVCVSVEVSVYFSIILYSFKAGSHPERGTLYMELPLFFHFDVGLNSGCQECTTDAVSP